MTSELLTIEEVARALRTSKGAIYQLRHRGEGPPATLIGKRLLFDQSALEAWLDARREQAD